jgi:hypothetical protein
MNEKEKANQIILKFEKLLYNKFTTNDEWVKCVECALICVNEIILANPHSNPFNTDVFSTIKYWEKVKNEIDKN